MKMTLTREAYVPKMKKTRIRRLPICASLSGDDI
jgi:hypothetical protein